MIEIGDLSAGTLLSVGLVDELRLVKCVYQPGGKTQVGRPVDPRA